MTGIILATMVWPTGTVVFTDRAAALEAVSRLTGHGWCILCQLEQRAFFLIDGGAGAGTLADALEDLAHRTQALAAAPGMRDADRASYTIVAKGDCQTCHTAAQFMSLRLSLEVPVHVIITELRRVAAASRPAG